MDRDDRGSIGAGCTVGFLETLDRGLARHGGRAGGTHALVERGAVDIDAVEERLIAERDGQRDDRDAKRRHNGGRQVAGRVGDDAYGHN